MAAEKGNKHAQVHDRFLVLAALESMRTGLVKHETKNVTTRDAGRDFNKEKKFIHREGYATLEEALLDHGLYPSKLSEWAETWADDEEVSQAIKALRETREAALVSNACKGSIPQSIAIFLMKAQLGYKDSGEETQEASTLPEGVSIEFDGDFSYDD